MGATLVKLVCAVRSARLVRHRGRVARSIDDRSARRDRCNIVLFRPTFSVFDSHMYGWTPVHSLSVMLLLPAVYHCRYAMQRDGYATPSSGDGAGICSSFAYTPNQLVFRHQKWHFSAVIINYLCGILAWNFTETFWGHPRPVSHLVKIRAL